MQAAGMLGQQRRGAIFCPYAATGGHAVHARAWARQPAVTAQPAVRRPAAPPKPGRRRQLSVRAAAAAGHSSAQDDGDRHPRLAAVLARLAAAAAVILVLRPLLARLLGQAAPGGLYAVAAACFLPGTLRRSLAPPLAASSPTQASTAEAQPEGQEGEGKEPEVERNQLEDISIASAEDAEPSGAPPPPALTALGNVQTPASVWLPYKDSSSQRNKIRAHIGPAVVTVGGRLARWLLVAVRLPQQAATLLSFKLQQVMLANTSTKLVAMFVLGIPLCLLGGVVYAWTSGRPILDGVINAYGALYKVPGVAVIGEVNAATAHVMNVLWMVGTFTFAIVLGVVTDDIVNTVMNIRSGNYSVIATNHTLILGWNSQTISLLRQIDINKIERGNGAYDGPVVILADRDKAAMDAELRAALRGCKLEWHTRCGQPHSITDLERVAAGQAKTIVLLNPDEEEEVGKRQVAALLAVQASRAATKPQPFMRLQPQSIAIQNPEREEDRQLLAAAQAVINASAQKFKLTCLSCKRDMSTLLALTAVQPGVASVYCTIVQQTARGVEFYLQAFPELAGSTFRDARRRFDDAVLCGYVRMVSGGEPELFINPDDDDVLQESDRVIALSETGRFQPVRERSEQKRARLVTGSEIVAAAAAQPQELRDPSMDRAKHIVVLWHDDHIADLLASLAVFAPLGSTITVISREPPEGWPEERLARGVCLQLLEGDPGSLEALQRAGVPHADAVVIGPTLRGRTAKEADALTTVSLMLAQECLCAAGRDAARPAHIVGMVHSPDSVQVANFVVERLGKGGATAELMHPDELVSGIISQVAAEPDIAPLFAAFVYSSEGSEIYLRRPQLYGLPEEAEISFAQIGELCRLRSEIAIGYISQNGEVILAPRATSVRTFDSNDRILTIADE